jgi:hypothetical protein
LVKYFWDEYLWLVYLKKYAVLVKCLWEKNICWVVIIVSHDLPVRECKIFVRWKIFVQFKKYLVNARGWGQDGHFGVWPHLSELTNGANLTDYGRNGFGVKKIWLSGLDVQPNFLVACVSNASFLMACVSKSQAAEDESERAGGRRTQVAPISLPAEGT